MHRSVAFPAAVASLVGIRHSTVCSAGVKYASPRLERRSAIFRTAVGIGMVTRTFWRTGAEALLPNTGVDLPELREPSGGLDGKDDDEPGKAVDKIRRTSKSVPFTPRDLSTSMETGSCRLAFAQDFKSG